MKTFSSESYGSGSNGGQKVDKVDFDKVNQEIVKDIFSSDSGNSELRKKVIKDDQEINGLASFIGRKKGENKLDDSDKDEDISKDLAGLGFLSGSDTSAWSKSNSSFPSMFGGPGGLKSKLGSTGFGSGGLFGGLSGSLF